MKFHKILTIAVATLAAAACSDQPIPTETPVPEAQFVKGPVASHSLLNNLDVTGTLSDGGTFEGLLSLTGLSLQDGQLVGSGTLTGTATDALGTVTEITQTFTDIPLSLLGSGGGSCDILNLDLGPLNLHLLGLVVDLSAVELDITAQRGPGNLLGNLLCAVAGLLDQGGPLSGIQNLLNQITSILG